ncbi:MAG: YWFCY domain-containing protein, partial [Rikenellaceae bacterium]
MSQEEDDLRALAKIIDIIRGASVLLVVLNIYWFCHEGLSEGGYTYAIIDKILINLNKTTALFENIVYSKLAALLMLGLSSMGSRGVPNERIKWYHIGGLFLCGGVLYMANWWVLELPLACSTRTILYSLSMGVGYLMLMAAGGYVSRLIRADLMNDRFNDENESFQQESRLIENEYSVNLPSRYYHNNRWNKGWINVVNPFRATIVLGTPGSGKSYAVVNSFIKQQIEKGFSMYLYDFKFADLSTIAYNH